MKDSRHFFFLDFYLVWVHLTPSLSVNSLQKSGMQGPSTPIDLFFVLVKKGKRTSFSLLCSYNARMINVMHRFPERWVLEVFCLFLGVFFVCVFLFFFCFVENKFKI